ncbi:MAG: hypothetical protein Ct9H300mP28_04910 [Pseudomonadota bacterium]|nr:MAG: hypothetical protein Ct9H300mP28_04910 [Pseudomonadota bacterium]
MKRMLPHFCFRLVFMECITGIGFQACCAFRHGWKFDKSFNEGIWNGLEKFRKKRYQVP